MNKQTIIGVLVVVAVVGVGAFYGGMTYANSQSPAQGNRQFTAQFNGNGGMRGNRGAGNLTAGEILSKDASSITIKMPDGSTRIALVSTSTRVTKSTDGSLGDLSTGTNVVVIGSANADGSLTAQSIQIRPADASSSRHPGL